MNSLEIINKLYKPYRITKLSKCTIIDSSEGSFVIKPKGEKDINELFTYLKSRDFCAFPNIVDESRSDVNIFEFINSSEYPKEQKAQDMFKLISLLHSKTSYEKSVTEDKYKQIYDNLNNNLNYYKDVYEKFIEEFEEEIFMSPSHYLFMRNSSKLLNQIAFCKNKLDDWYESVKNKKSSRVALIHNNLCLDHFIKGDKEVLISWDNATNAPPILDIYGFYQKEALNLDFASLLDIYKKYYPLEPEELELLFIMFCMPREISFQKNEFCSCEMLEKELDYVFKTEALVRPYYLKDDKE